MLSAPDRSHAPERRGCGRWTDSASGSIGSGASWTSITSHLSTVVPSPLSGRIAYSNPIQVWSPASRPLRPKTGEIVWHYQFNPNDTFDYDAVNEMVQANLNVNGENKKVILHANRNGFLYVLDRTNGKVLEANTFVPKVNWASGIDLKTGRPIETEVTVKARTGEKTEVGMFSASTTSFSRSGHCRSRNSSRMSKTRRADLISPSDMSAAQSSRLI